VVERGSGALLAARGAPRKLSDARERRALKLSESGVTGAEIARRLGVSEATVSRLLARARAAAVAQGRLDFEQRQAAEPEQETGKLALSARDAGEKVVDLKLELELAAPAEPREKTETVVVAAGETGVEVLAAEVPEPTLLSAEPQAPAATIERLGQVEVQSRYAGAMLLYPFLDRLDVDRVLGSLAAGDARRYDAPALILSACFSFALGSCSLEQTKHLVLTDAGALIAWHWRRCVHCAPGWRRWPRPLIRC
jgi:DNA-binding CsgD family transcriptional regulator